MNEILKYALIFAAVLLVVGIVLAAFDVEIGWYIILLEMLAAGLVFDYAIIHKDKKIINKLIYRSSLRWSVFLFKIERR